MKTFAAEHTVATVCPLDCPDSCSLEVTTQDGRVTSIDGSSLNPVTSGCRITTVASLSSMTSV